MQLDINWIAMLFPCWLKVVQTNFVINQYIMDILHYFQGTAKTLQKHTAKFTLHECLLF